MKNIALACVFVIVQTGVDVSDYALEETLGISLRQLPMARETVEKMISENAFVTELERKKRKDFI